MVSVSPPALVPPPLHAVSASGAIAAIAAMVAILLLFIALAPLPGGVMPCWCGVSRVARCGGLGVGDCGPRRLGGGALLDGSEHSLHLEPVPKGWDRLAVRRNRPNEV